MPSLDKFTGLIGMALIILTGYLLSSNRRAIKWKVVGWGVGLQVVFAIFVLRVPFGQELFRRLGDLVTTVLHYSYVGSEFVFGELGKPSSTLGVIFAFQILPAIIFVSALFAVMYYLGVMQVIVRAFAVVMSRIMSASGAESLNVAASISCSSRAARPPMPQCRQRPSTACRADASYVVSAFPARKLSRVGMGSLGENRSIACATTSRSCARSFREKPR